MKKENVVKIGGGVVIAGAVFYGLSLLPAPVGQYRMMLADVRPEPGIETLIFTDSGYTQEKSLANQPFFLERSSLFYFSERGELLLQRETFTGSSKNLLPELFDLSRPVTYGEIDPSLRKYLPLPTNLQEK